MADLKPFFQDCIYKKHLGVECPGCGFQRSFELLINGDFIASIKMYPPLITLIIMVVFLGVHVLFNFKRGAKILLWLFILNAVIITANFIFKIAT